MQKNKLRPLKGDAKKTRVSWKKFILLLQEKRLAMRDIVKSHIRNEKVLRITFAISRAAVVLVFLVGLWLITISVLPYLSGSAFGVRQIGSNPYDWRTSRKIRIMLHFDQFKEQTIQVKRLLGDLGLFVELREISIPPVGTLSLGQNICIDKIYFAPHVTPTPQLFRNNVTFQRIGISIDSLDYYEFKDFCSSEDAVQLIKFEDSEQTELSDHRVVHGNLSQVFPIAVDPSFYYPWDKRILDFSIMLYGHFQDGKVRSETFLIEPELIDVVGFITALDWDEEVEISKEQIIQNMNSNNNALQYTTQMKIIYRRPLFQRMLSIILLGALTCFSVALAFIKDLGTFMDVGIGILLGLWGVQGILIPTNIDGPFIITSFIMLIYLLLVVAVLFRFLFLPIWNITKYRSDPKEQGEN